MAWDPVKFLDRHNIHYVTEGPNTKKGNVSIQCPFCGEMDNSQHMGIRIRDGVWGCWRDDTHRGRSPARLIQVLIGCSWEEAKAIAGGSRALSRDTFDALLDGSIWEGDADRDITEGVSNLEMPKDFRDIVYDKRSSYPYYCYMNKRGYKGDHARRVINRYSLKYCLNGDYSKRIIIPYYMNGQLVTWSSRHIGRSRLRYKTLTAEESVIPTKSIIYNYDLAAEGGTILFVVEGPLDVIKLDYACSLGHYDAHAVGISSLVLEDDQMWFLKELADKYDTVAITLDRGEFIGSIRMEDKLGFIQNKRIVSIKDASDPGALTIRQAKRFIEGVSNEKSKTEKGKKATNRFRG